MQSPFMYEANFLTLREGRQAALIIQETPFLNMIAMFENFFKRNFVDLYIPNKHSV